MQTQAISGSGSKCPCLEFFPQPGAAAQKVPLEKSPFVVGRIETVDLQIDSTRVSREHAQITREKGGYFVRDLGSTNGTFVNGEQVTESKLRDGDTILIADTELAFVAATSDRFRRMATQPMTNPARPRCKVSHFINAVDDLRQLHEVALHRYVPCRVDQIVSLRDANLFAYHAATPAARMATSDSTPHAVSFSVPCRPSATYAQMQRTAAFEKVRHQRQLQRLLVDVETWEIETNGHLESHLGRIGDLLHPHAQLIVAIDANAAMDLHTVRSFLRRLEELAVQVCLKDFVGGGPQVMQYEQSPPDFVMLSPSMLKNGIRRTQQHAQLQSLLEACQSMNCQVIVTGIEDEECEEACQQLGFELTQRAVGFRAESANHEHASVECAV